MKYSLPESANDLLIKDGKLLMRSLSVYEVLRRFGHIVRLTPFRFEDFTAALLAEEQSALLAEIHIQLLKTLLREDRQQQTWLGPPDLKDSVNIYLLSADYITWPAALRIYLSADPRENAAILEKLGNYGSQINNYPFNAILQDKLDVLEQLCDQFLLSNLAREEIVNGNGGGSQVVKQAAICRACSKPNGDLILCKGCSALYHLKCSDPPLNDYPDEDDEDTYLCVICRSNHIKGVSDCMDLIGGDQAGIKRLEPLGIDKQGRRYWFLVRRLFVVDENEDDVRYYTNTNHLAELIENLNHEKGLRDLIQQERNEIERQMKITEDLYQTHMNGYKREDGTYSQFLGQDGQHKNYVNHYHSSTASSTNGKNNKQHSDLDVNRSLSNKFSVNSLNSFKWSGAINGSLNTLTVTIRATILRFESTLPHTFIHPCWQQQQKSSWIRSINYGLEPQDYAIALSQLETCIKPVLYKPAWYESAGFTQLFRSTAAEREELKKTDRQPRGFERREWFSQDFELSYRLGTMVKFSAKLKPVKHQVWKQKGEEYRLTGLNAWYWRSCTFTSRLRRTAKLYRIEPFRWLSPMNSHPFIVDKINELIRSTDVIDVAENLSKDENQRLLYPKKPLLNDHKQKRISKLEGLLKLKLTELERKALLNKSNNENNIETPTKPDPVAITNTTAPPANKKIKLENGDVGNASINSSETKIAPSISINSNSNSNALNTTKENSNQMTNGTENTVKPALTDTKIIFYSTNQVTPTRTNMNLSTNINILTPINKSSSMGQQQQILKKCVLAKPKLPPCHDFLAKRSKIRSILVLPDLELHKLARSGGLREVKSFSYTAKQNSYIWPYGMTPRPTFRTAWLYRNRFINSMQDVALQLKIIYACIRWDDVQVRPPASGHNVITTDESNITIELLKKRDRLPYLTHSEYLIRKVMTPIEQQTTKYRKGFSSNRISSGSTPVTPSARSGLRARRQVEKEEEKGPTTVEVWVPEDQLELWELKQFDEKIERQNQLMRERALKEETERRRKIEEEKRRKAEQERRRRVEEEAKKARLAQQNASPSINNTAATSTQSPRPNITIAQPRSLPTTPVLRYFRTEQGQIIRLPASYLQRGTPLILRHVGPGANQTNTYIIRPQISPVTTNIAIGVTSSTPTTTGTTPVTMTTPTTTATLNVVLSSATSATPGVTTTPTTTLAATTTAPIATPAISTMPTPSEAQPNVAQAQNSTQQTTTTTATTTNVTAATASTEATLTTTEATMTISATATAPVITTTAPTVSSPAPAPTPTTTAQQPTTNAPPPPLPPSTLTTTEPIQPAAETTTTTTETAAPPPLPSATTTAIATDQCAGAQESVGTVVNELAHVQHAPTE